MIAITVEKGMDWKQAVVPTLTVPLAAAAPALPTSVAQPVAAAGAKPPPSGQYIYFIYLYIYIFDYTKSFIFIRFFSFFLLIYFATIS